MASKKASKKTAKKTPAPTLGLTKTKAKAEDPKPAEAPTPGKSPKNIPAIPQVLELEHETFFELVDTGDRSLGDLRCDLAEARFKSSRYANDPHTFSPVLFDSPDDIAGTIVAGLKPIAVCEIRDVQSFTIAKSAVSITSYIGRGDQPASASLLSHLKETTGLDHVTLDSVVVVHAVKQEH